MVRTLRGTFWGVSMPVIFSAQKKVFCQCNNNMKPTLNIICMTFSRRKERQVIRLIWLKTEGWQHFEISS